MRNTWTAGVAGVIALAAACAAQTGPAGLELTPAAVADAKGDGGDGKANTADDTWGFWFQVLHAPQYLRLDIATAALSPERRAGGIPRKVTGPIASMLPNPDDTDGHIFHSDWDGRYEGVWGDRKAGQVLAHPYTEKTTAGAVAITCKVPADGVYTLTAAVRDLNVVQTGHRAMTGIIAILDVLDAGDGKAIQAPARPLATAKVGDKAGPESATLTARNVKLRAGQLVRLVIDPNKSWAGDLTRIEAFRIEKSKE